jgi:photosystem II stability/assembly factor-like uncharacterized protein
MDPKSYYRKTLFNALVLSMGIYLSIVSSLTGQTLDYVHPRPSGDWISNVAIVPGTQRFIAIAENTNNIFQSDDFGGTIAVRNDVPIDYSSDLFAGGYGDIEFINETTGFLTSGEIIYRTTDGGNTFVEVANGSVFSHDKIVMNGDFGAAWTARRILYTSDGGSNWSTQNVSTSEFISDLAVLSDGKVIIVGSHGFYQESTDGARTWANVMTPVPSSRFIVSVNFLNDNDGFISNDFGDIYHTSDGGETWKEGRSEPNTPIDFVDIDTNGIVRGIERGTLFQSDDAGASWTELFDFDEFMQDAYGDYIRMDITSLDFQGDLGVATGEHGLMLVTKDGGANWTLLTELLTEKDIDDLHQFGDQVMAVGDGFVLISSDAGDNWQVASRPADDALNYVDRMANGSWIIGGDGDVYISSDFGANWTVINLGINFEIFQGLIGADEKIFLIGEKGQVAQSTDNGLTWQIDTLPLSNENHDLTAIDFLNDSIGVIGAENDAVFKTVDGGVTWSDISLPTNSTKDIVLLKLLNPDELLVYRTQDFYRSLDGGLSYERFSSEDAEAIAIRDDGMGINNELGDIRITTDYGETWREWTDLADNSFTKATISDEGHVLFSGEGGVIVKIEDVFLTSSRKEHLTLSPEHDFKVVPNPTRGQFNLVLDKPITAPYTLKIFHVLGQLAYTQESSGIGSQSISVNIGGHLPAGSYFISLEAEGSMLGSKRFIILE